MCPSIFSFTSRWLFSLCTRMNGAKLKKMHHSFITSSQEDGSCFGQLAPIVKSQKYKLWFSNSANAVVKLNAFVSWIVSGCPSMQQDAVKRQRFESRGSVWSWSLEQSQFSPGLTCISEAVCQFRIVCNDIAERCDFSKYCRKQVSGLTLCFVQNSR